MSGISLKWMIVAVLWITVMMNQGVRTAEETGKRKDHTKGPLSLLPDHRASVVGVAGRKVSLPCDITPPGKDDSVSLILWYKDESTTPIYSLDARRGNLEQARHAASDSLASRAYLTTVLKPASLQLDPSTLDDQGEYRCRVDFRKARTRNTVITLQIVVPPEKPVIMDQHGEVLQSLIGPYNEGDRLFLTCETQGGKPLPSLTWWRESVLLDDSYEVTSQGVVRNDFEIPSLQRHDLMAVLTCQAVNNNVSLPRSSAVTVDMNFRPLLVAIEGHRRAFSAEKPADVVCKTAGSRPPASITWWKGSTKMKRTREKISVDGNVTTSVLTFVPTSDDTGKHLSCRAENHLIPNSAIEDGWKLEIHYVPQVTLRLGSKLRHSHIQEGNDVYLECTIRASPWVTDIRWWFEGREIHTNTTAGIIVSNQSLVLQKVHRGNRGRYTCSATNTEGEGESNPVHLRVQYAPVCKPGQKIIYGAARQESVKISCDVEADPSEVTFRWGFNNSADNMEVVNFVAESTSSVATYIPRTEYDYGTLFCWAKNSVAIQKEPCVYTIIPAGPPDPVRNCSITNQTEDSIAVECFEGYDGGLLQHFVMEVHQAYPQQKLKANMTSYTPSFTARGLPAGTKFMVLIYAANVKGRSTSVALLAETLPPPESLTRQGNVWQLSFSPILGVLIAAVTGLVLVALLILSVMKLRSRFSRKRDHSGYTKDKAQIPLRKDADDRCDVCTCSAEVDDKCPDIIPDIGLSADVNMKECSAEKNSYTAAEEVHWRTQSPVPSEKNSNSLTYSRNNIQSTMDSPAHVAAVTIQERSSPPTTLPHMAPMQEYTLSARAKGGLPTEETLFTDIPINRQTEV